MGFDDVAFGVEVPQIMFGGEVVASQHICWMAPPVTFAGFGGTTMGSLRATDLPAARKAASPTPLASLDGRSDSEPTKSGPSTSSTPNAIGRVEVVIPPDWGDGHAPGARPPGPCAPPSSPLFLSPFPPSCRYLPRDPHPPRPTLPAPSSTPAGSSSSPAWASSRPPSSSPQPKTSPPPGSAATGPSRSRPTAYSAHLERYEEYPAALDNHEPLPHPLPRR